VKKIDVEAHFYTKEYQDYLFTRKETPREEFYKDYIRLWYEPNIWEPHGPAVENRLLDLAEGRLRDMDEAGIDMQVLSLSTPGCEQFSPVDGTTFSSKTNNELAEAIKKYPDRFIGLAALAPQSPDEAARELERTVTELGFKGVKINSHVGDTYLDDKKYWAIFEVAEKLDVPIYLHPNTPISSMIQPYADYGFALAGPALGFTIEAAVHTMRLIYSGLFDTYPDLKIILGHMGEGLIHWLYRIDFSFIKPWMDEEVRPKIKKIPSRYIKDNFMVTTSGMNVMQAFLNTYLEIGADRIMFSADYPYESSNESAAFIEKVPISDTDKMKIMYLNAEKLFKIS
jgi:2,3-dihydroxybenzoate decarboxylase